MVLRGASAQNAYIGYVPVTNAEYAEFNAEFVYDKGKDNYPAVGISIKDAEAYCDWLTAKAPKHTYRLPSEEEWILAAGHMPKDVAMNSGHIERGLTAVDAYVKGGSWDSKRDDCRSEKSDDVRNGVQGYANVGFRVVRVNDH